MITAAEWRHLCCYRCCLALPPLLLLPSAVKHCCCPVQSTALTPAALSGADVVRKIIYGDVDLGIVGLDMLAEIGNDDPGTLLRHGICCVTAFVVRRHCWALPCRGWCCWRLCCRPLTGNVRQHAMRLVMLHWFHLHLQTL